MKLKSPLDVPNPMRYLVVPSQETEIWKEYLDSKEWLERKYSIEIEGEKRAIPLSELFPLNLPTNLSEFEIIEKNAPEISPNDYLGHLKKEIGDVNYNKFKRFWPQSFDLIGELVIVKIEKEVEKFTKEISHSMISHNKRVSRVFRDLGVHGNFRVRKLELIGGSKNLGGATKVKENGVEFNVDPTKGYYSPRLATERLDTLECAIYLKTKLERKLNICDPYAGFGPALMPLIKEKGLVNYILANDLNPEVTTILEENLITNNKENVAIEIKCKDARKLIENPKNIGLFDLLLVNLPHSTIEHLPLLVGLLNNNSTAILRAWSIIDSEKIKQMEDDIKKLFDSLKYPISNIIVEPTRSYSPTQVYTKIEIWTNESS
tara:strand:- start:3955 stop:5082 length:1128 start_codon:yes stop_codon:yes gene_type:complete